jgi:hypothetical protein
MVDALIGQRKATWRNRDCEQYPVYKLVRKLRAKRLCPDGAGFNPLICRGANGNAICLSRESRTSPVRFGKIVVRATPPTMK